MNSEFLRHRDAISEKIAWSKTPGGVIQRSF